jgi:transposase
MAMESTGVYWKPVFYTLESDFTCLLVNAAHIKQVPGRKTDVKDCVWIAQLLEHGLLRGSFVPPAPIRDLRDLTRYRKALIHDRTRVANRLHRALEEAGMKLASVASDILGVSGRAMLAALVQGTTDPAVLADLARGRLATRSRGLSGTARGTCRAARRGSLPESGGVASSRQAAHAQVAEGEAAGVSRRRAWLGPQEQIVVHPLAPLV